MNLIDFDALTNLLTSPTGVNGSGPMRAVLLLTQERCRAKIEGSPYPELETALEAVIHGVADEEDLLLIQDSYGF